MNTRLAETRSFASRRGVMLPAIAFALLVVGGAMALVLNTLWKDSAQVELRTAAEASALAAAGEYLTDPLLNPQADRLQHLEWAKTKAAQIAFSNRVAGRPLELDLSEENGDIYFGQRLEVPVDDPSVFLPSLLPADQSVFVRTDENPNVVEVRASRMRSQGNPIRLFFPGIMQQSGGDAVAFAEVCFDNVIAGFQPSPSRPVPALPLASLKSEPFGKRADTWDVNIEQRLGADQYRYDPQTRQVIAEPDGIPEMELYSMPLSGDETARPENFQLLEFQNNLSEAELARQIRDGLTAEDLKAWDGRLPAQQTLPITGSAIVAGRLPQALADQIGQQRLCLLYREAQPLNVRGWSQVVCEGVVAIRILDVIVEEGEAVRMIVQPTVMSTSTAQLARFYLPEQPSWGLPTEIETFASNRYVYKIYISQ